MGRLLERGGELARGTGSGELNRVPLMVCLGSTTALGLLLPMPPF